MNTRQLAYTLTVTHNKNIPMDGQPQWSTACRFHQQVHSLDCSLLKLYRQIIKLYLEVNNLLHVTIKDCLSNVRAQLETSVSSGSCTTPSILKN